MNKIEELVLVTAMILVIIAIPPLLIGDLWLGVYGFGSCGAGALIMQAVLSADPDKGAA